MVSGGPAAVDEEWIVDTGPVIILAQAGRLDLLTHLARVVLLPSPVVREIRRGPATGAARRAVEDGWGTEVPVRYIRVAVRAVGLLGPGEQSVLTIGLKRPGSRVVLDDRQARKAAQALGLPMTGTVGVILFARRYGLVPAVVPLFQAIRVAGLYVEEAILQQAAAAVGETWP